MTIKVEGSNIRSDFKSVDLVYDGVKVNYTVDYLFKGIVFQNVPVVTDNSQLFGFYFDDTICDRIIALEKRLTGLEFSITSVDFLTGNKEQKHVEFKVLEFYTEKAVVKGKNETWVFEEDETSLEDWKVYQDVYVSEILEVSADFENQNRLFCKVIGYNIKD